MSDTIYRQDAIDALNVCVTIGRGNGKSVAFKIANDYADIVKKRINALPSAQPEEVIPHRNYKYLLDYWCACGWHLGKKGEVKYCADCGRKVNWNG